MTPKKLGRPHAATPQVRVSVTAPQSDIDDLRTWFGNASRGIRELAAKERAHRQNQQKSQKTELI